jgi:uncharacterized protein (DUF1697 family)
MATYIGLLRAVNLPGHNKVSMRDLQLLLASLGMEEARTLLQSGNVVFRTGVSQCEKVERLLEDAAAKRLGVSTDFFVRTATEWNRIVSANPFRDEATRDPGHLLVMVLKKAPAAGVVAALQKAITGREIIRASGREAYIIYPDGVGRSRLTAARLERALATRGTARNWNTVLKLAALAAASRSAGV